MVLGFTLPQNRLKTVKDAFGNTIRLNDRVICATKNGAGITYFVGLVRRLVPTQPLPPGKHYTPPDRVEIEPLKLSQHQPGYLRHPLFYASTVVVLDKLDEI